MHYGKILRYSLSILSHIRKTHRFQSAFTWKWHSKTWPNFVWQMSLYFRWYKTYSFIMGKFWYLTRDFVFCLKILRDSFWSIPPSPCMCLSDLCWHQHSYIMGGYSTRSCHISVHFQNCLSVCMYHGWRHGWGFMLPQTPPTKANCRHRWVDKWL